MLEKQKIVCINLVIKTKQIDKPHLNPALFKQTQASTHPKICNANANQGWKKEELSDSANVLTGNLQSYLLSCHWQSNKEMWGQSPQ